MNEDNLTIHQETYDVNSMNDEKRFALLPLSYENRDRALRGEMILDDKTGNVWVKNRQTGELVSATQDVKQHIDDAINARTANIAYAFSNNRNVYRFYFDKNMVKLDASLNLPSEYVYYTIRDTNRQTKYYLNGLTRVTDVATSIYPEVEEGSIASNGLRNNGTYIVEFYNINFELMTQILFTAKKAPALQVAANELDKIVDHIVVASNRDILYIGESIKSVNCRVYAVFKDGSRKDTTDFSNVKLQYAEGTILDGEVTLDVTESKNTLIDLDNIDTSKPGDYTIVASYYDKLLGDFRYATKTVTVSENEYERLLTNGIVIIPRVVALAGTAKKEIRLQVIGYFEDGSKRDITNEVVISDYNSSRFDVEQFVTVTFRVGHETVSEVHTSFTAYSDPSETPNNYRLVNFNNDLGGGYILNLHESYTPVKACTYYRVRSIDDLTEQGYYTVKDTNLLGYPALYVDIAKPLSEGDYVIVEFYSINKALIASELFNTAYVEYSNINSI